MTPAEQKRIADLFERVVDLPEDQREAVLAAAEPGIADEVRALLAASSEEWEPSAKVARPAEIPGLGANVAGYKLDQVIGRGGFGVVYRAFREVGGTRSPVAIKFLKASVASSQMKERFDFERQLLAELDHPGISRLLDGGATESGIPYVVMEYVHGSPIDQCCDGNHLSISDRLAIFIKVCEIVEYAHSLQLLHRDIKPPNILVTEDGSPKLLDFGIAKLLSPAPGAPPATLPHQHVFSLSHASPEQLEGRPLTVATDVYSLGVVLYELVSGRLPFSRASLWSVAEARAARGRAPAPPSEAFLSPDALPSDGPESVRRISEARGTHPARLRRELRGDLDRIVLASLRSDPAERYSSVESLRLDVERLLAKLPVEVTRGGRAYRVEKWVRRNPATAVVLGLAVGLMLWGMDQSGVEQFRAAEARNQSLKSLADVEAIVFPGLPALTSSLETDPARNALLDVQIEMLRRLDELPPSLRAATQRRRAFAMQASALALWSLNRKTEAESILGAAVDEGRAALETSPRDREWRSFYKNVLETRATFRTELGMQEEAGEDRRRLMELEASGVADATRGK